ncbi:MAG: hypothetical protein HZB31_04615 [Nitrospirae bacterium]|nr:hypothetical protein [Nitrospirota bacterium]
MRIKKENYDNFEELYEMLDEETKRLILGEFMKTGNKKSDESHDRLTYQGGRRSMNTGTICELMIALLYLIKIIFH